MLKEFNTNIKNGPTSICCCCGNTWFPIQTKKIKKSVLISKGATPDFIQKCFNHNRTEDENTFCATCHLDITKLHVPKSCLENGFKYDDIPECLRNLNRIEERLVSPRHVFQSIRTVAGAHGQFRHRGAITNIPVNVDTTVTQLPR